MVPLYQIFPVSARKEPTGRDPKYNCFGKVTAFEDKENEYLS
jgi:hypothetical protein